MNVVDYIIIGIILISIISGLYKGFVHSLLSLGSSIVSIFVAFIFSPKLIAYINSNKGIMDLFSGIFSKNGLVKDMDLANQSISSLTTTNLSTILDNIQLPKPFDSIITNSIKNAMQGVSNISVNEFLSSAILSIALNIICFIICYFLANFIVSMILSLINGIFRFSALKYFDSLAGGLLGLIRGVIFVFILFTLLPLIETLVPIKELKILIENSKYAAIFQNTSFIINIFNRRL